MQRTLNREYSSFGIGCFHFGIKLKEGYFEEKSYVEQLKKTLEEIPSIDNISIDYNNAFADQRIQITNPKKSSTLDTTLGCFPNPLFLKVGFEVAIPARTQIELLKPFIFSKNPPKKFLVSIFYTYHLPVVFVEPIKPAQNYSPSQSVQTVREFLRQEFARIKSEIITFECLGPSPFHVDCYIRKASRAALLKERTKNGKLRLSLYFSEVNYNRGYDDVVFYTSEKSFSRIADLKSLMFKDITHELGFFYSIVQQRNRQIYKWERIQKLIREVSRAKEKGFWRTASRFVPGVNPDIIRETQNRLAKFRVEEMEFQSRYQHTLKQVYPSPDWGHFRIYVEDEFRNRPRYPIQETTELLEFYEKRRVASIQNFLLVASALLGGAIGSLITLYFT